MSKKSGKKKEKRLNLPVNGHGVYRPYYQQGHFVGDWFSGAWQQNQELEVKSVHANPTVFACMTLIASDVSKLRIKIVQKDKNGIWNETKNSNFSPVLRKPNKYQTRNQFFESWVLSKLSHGNTYALKLRDFRNVVIGLYVLDPKLVTPLVADNGDIFYQLATDQLSGLPNEVTVPASEIIHDRFNCLFHPLVGISPLYASAMTAYQGLFIIKNSTAFFGKGSTSPGILTAPGSISDETAQRLKSNWEANYSGDNAGKVAVLGDGLHFEAMSVSATDSQLVEQLQWTSRTIASVFHVPPYKVGIETPPNYSIEAINLDYYTQCLQRHLEDIESVLDEGLGLDGETTGTEFDLDGLLRMDMASMIEAEGLAVDRAIKTRNEARRRFDLPPIEGGDDLYVQQQYFPISELARQSLNEQKAQQEPIQKPTNDNSEDQAIKFQIALAKKLGLKQISIA